MDRRSSRNSGVVLTGLLAFAAVGVGSASDARASSITVMPLGDSITYGFSAPAFVPGGYRGQLYRDLTAAGFDAHFVGSSIQNYDPTLPPAASPHEGHPGFQIDSTGPFAGISANASMDKWLAPGNGVNPDVILLMLGANSIVGQYHVAGAPYELAALITKVSHLRPNAQILVSTLTPQTTAANEAQVQQFNRTLSGPQGVIAQLRALGEKVTLVDVGSALTPSDISDLVHPTKAGYVKLGDAWFRAIVANHVTPAPEPSTLALLGVGAVAGLVVTRARKRPDRA